MPGHPPGSSANAPDSLASNAMGTKDLVFTVLAALAPLTLIVAVAPLHFLKGGAAVPGGYLVAGVVMALFAVGFMTMSRYVRNAGAFYATISRGLGKPAGSGAAMLAVVAYNALQISTYGALGVYANETFKNYFHRDVPWWVFAIVGLVFVGWLGYRGIHTSARILGALLVLETAVLVVLAVYVLAKGGAGDWSAESFAPSRVFDPGNGAMFALVAGAFMGFEATAIFSEEARGGIRTVRRATYIAVAFIAVFYAFVTWVIVMAYGVDKIGPAAEADPVNLVVAVFDRYVPAPITEVMHILLLTSAFAALLALHNAANRYFYAMGREGLLPRALGRTHPRTKAPWTAGLVQTVLAAVAVVVFAVFGIDPYLGLLLWGSALGFLGIICLWAFCSLAIIRFLRRQAPEAGIFRTTIAPGLSFAALAVVLFLVLSNLPLLTGAGTTTNILIVGLGVAAVVAGVARALYLRARAPRLYAGWPRRPSTNRPRGGESPPSEMPDHDTSSPGGCRGYLPLDLAGVLNAPRSVLDDGDSYRLGSRTLYGLPFLFGDEGNAGAALLRVGGPDPATVTVEVDRAFTWMVVAHALESPDLFDGQMAGQLCGHYTLVYDDGTTERLPVRQRLEIGPTPRLWSDRAIPLDWGQTPFLAVPDAQHRLMPRTHGRFDAAGARFVDIDDPQARSPYVLPYRFYLWPCRNPRPEKTVRVLEIHSAGPAILVGALTVSELDEDPFGRTVWRDVLLDLGPSAGPISEDLAVTVDRGSATYVYRTVGSGDAAAGDTPAWGTPVGEHHQGYVRVTATPSARLTLTRGEKVISACGWEELLTAGRHSDGGVTWRVPDAGRAWVRTTVRDAATGEPVPCRIHFRSADGVPYPPHGHHGHINSDGNTWNLDIGGDVRLGTTTYSYVDGTCEGWLPLGEVTVEAARGFEYEPLRTTVTIRPGQTELELTLARVTDLAADGWYSGDTHVHFVSTLGAELEARGEDVRVTNLLLSQWGHLFTNTEEFTGRPHTSHDGHTHVFAGQENRSGMLGHINLLGLRRPIMPWCTGGAEESELGGGLETTLSHWADECHEQGGTVVLAHFPVPNGEAAALLATGRLDAVEMIAYDQYNIQEYYRYLNAGYRITLVGGTDKMSSEVPIGLIRTYAHVPADEEFDYWAWCRAVRAGATFVTSGPLLWLDVDGRRPGQDARVPASGTVRVEARVQSIFDVDRLEIVVNGHVVAERRIDTPGRVLELTADVPVTEDSWIAARCYGPGADVARHHDVWARPIMAHTSPVYLRTGEEYARFDAATVDHMLNLVDGSLAYIDERSRRLWPGQVCHRHGQEDHLAFLRAPFLQARELLRERKAAG